MKTNIFILIINTLALFAFLSCENEPNVSPNDDETLKAIVSFQDSVDKEIWSDFNFVLQLDKPVYSIGEQINVLTYFYNIGDKTITLDGILPYRQSANPPTVELQLNDTLIFRTNKFLENLNNENDIIIEPNGKVFLNKFDLLEVEGQLMILDKKTNFYYGADTSSIEAILSKGSYKIHSFFHPTPQVYGSITDTLTFTIE
jgi:hypothetical protein